MVCACVYVAFTYTKAMASDRRRAEMSEGRRQYERSSSYTFVVINMLVL